MMSADLCGKLRVRLDGVDAVGSQRLSFVVAVADSSVAFGADCGDGNLRRNR